MQTDTSAPAEVVQDMRSVCYRPGKPTIADYNEAIESLLAAKHQLQSGSLMGCDVCGDSGHAAQDGCHHDPLLLARQWVAATRVWQCYHCGFTATNDEEAREHFGKSEHQATACTRAQPLAADALDAGTVEACAKAMCNAAWASVGEDWSLASDEQQDEFRLMARTCLALSSGKTVGAGEGEGTP